MLISRPVSLRGACRSGGETISTWTDVQDEGWALCEGKGVAGTLGYDFKSCPSTQRASVWEYAESSKEELNIELMHAAQNICEIRTLVIY